jgi:hypothetical protein
MKRIFSKPIINETEVYMNFVGFYPFTVNVWNLFAPSTGIKLKVSFYHHQCYFEVNDTDRNKVEHFKVEHTKTDCESIIQPGKSLSFPMYFGDESLEISLHLEGNDAGNEPTTSYLISAGDTAECMVIATDPVNIEREKERDPVDGTSASDTGKNGFWKGGIWDFEPGSDDPPKNDKEWKLTIRKKIVDPQSDDVTIGPGTPG